LNGLATRAIAATKKEQRQNFLLPKSPFALYYAYMRKHFGGLPMRPPAKKRIEADTAPAPADSRTEALQEKAKLAQYLHAQGVNPVRWTEAHPAPQSDQATFQKTGLKSKDNQFEVGGKLYDWSPAVTATPAQAKAIADAYVAERSGKDDDVISTPKIEELVDIDAVPLKHPLGTPHTERPAEEHAALIRHYAQSGVDPDKAHLGDPVNMKDQERLKAQIEKTLPGDKTEISGLPGFYQGFEDGWIYKTNEYTRPSGGVTVEEKATANDNTARRSAVELDSQNSGPDAHPTDTSNTETNLKEKAIAELAAAANHIDAITNAVEHIQSNAQLTESDKIILERIKAAFVEVGLEFDPKNANLEYLRTVAGSIKRAALNSAADRRVPLHVLVQQQNDQLAQALLGETVTAAQFLDPNNAEVRAATLAKASKSNPAITLMGSTIAAYLFGKTAAEVVKEQAKEDGTPNFFSPYADGTGALTGDKTPATQAVPSSGDILQRLSATDISKIDRMFSSEPSTFNRSAPTPMSPTQKADMLTSGTVSEIELFGLPIYLTDPRGSLQTQERIDKLKKMVRDKLVECGMTEEDAWGGEVAEHATERAKERFVPRGEGGVKGSRRADLSFKIRWFGRTYIIDINTVDVLKNGSMTKAERIAAEGLRLNRLIRLIINEGLPDGSKLDEYEGKIGTVPKGKDMTDEEWETAAKEWVDSFLDCDGPLEADVYLDPESKHPWRGKE
jgi:hypothetical protein